MKTFITYIIICFFAISTLAQEKKKIDAVEAEILFDYYSQDGDNSAVTGGKGTEKLRNTAPLISVKIPLNETGKLSVKGGIDAYTSASSGNIDLYSTGASGSSSNKVAASEKDVRKHFNIGYVETFANSELSFNGGYSTEYDVNSVNAGVGYAKDFNNKNQRISIAGNAYVDRWLLIYPGEIRNPSSSGNEHDDDDKFFARDDDDDDDDDDDHGEGSSSTETLSKDDFNTDVRYTYNLNLGFQSVINRKTNFAVILDITRQNGILNTPFHRVYFDDNINEITRKTVKAENLPRKRWKAALGFRLNRFLTHSIISRLYYRFYIDDFGIRAHTFSVELPIKTSPTITFYPFLRFYNQNNGKYFAPFGEHNINATYYTSDYDQSSFSSFHKGVGLKIAPPNGIFNFSNHFFMKSFQIRFSNYERTNGLKANNITISTQFNL